MAFASNVTCPFIFTGGNVQYYSYLHWVGSTKFMYLCYGQKTAVIRTNQFHLCLVDGLGIPPPMQHARSRRVAHSVEIGNCDKV